jgi:hypothetical protein
MTHSATPDTPKTVPRTPPAQHMPASVGWTLAMLLSILVIFVALVFWYMR